MTDLVALDHDSTLADIQPVAFDLLHGDDHDYDTEDVESWEWGIEKYGADRYLTALWHAWTLRPDDIDPCEDNLAETVSLLRDVARVHIVTAHPDQQGITEGKEYWLEKHGIEYDEFRPVHNGRSKADLDYDRFIDDKPQLAENINDHQVLYLIDRPWNQDVQTRDNVHRVDSVSEVVDMIAGADDQ